MTPGAIAVVIPAHDEERRIQACLRSVRAAAAFVAPVPVVIVVAADACTDATATLAAQGGASVVPTWRRSVGAARAVGVDHALTLLADSGPDVWLAMTDADTTVPPPWLAHQLLWARQGYDAVLGTISLASTAVGALHVARHDADYFRTRRPGGTEPGWEHPHVHGANLGVSASAYLGVGGFAPLPTGEDHDLAVRLASAGHRIARTDRHPVRTAARLRGRAPGGLAGLLRALRDPVARGGDLARHRGTAGLDSARTP
ncbi:glycosyltransferase [Streptomyces sp. NPDC060188]|uniref:glycosyltransferase n=1 Tax=Streptomyces sp. NPDC060188 TaxID=3347068 RepID=UPI0036618C1A